MNQEKEAESQRNQELRDYIKNELRRGHENSCRYCPVNVVKWLCSRLLHAYRATKSQESTGNRRGTGGRPEHSERTDRGGADKIMKYRKLNGYKYDTQADEHLDIDIYENAHNDYISLDHGHLIIKKGYAWDGASGPAIDDKTNMMASLVHDALYQLMREGLIERTHRKYIDKLFREICLKNGMSKFRAWYYYQAVRIFSRDSSFARKHPRGEVIEV